MLIAVLACLGSLLGAWLSYAVPTAPLLAFWLLLGLSCGMLTAVHPQLRGLRSRATWLLTGGAIFVIGGLWTTQIAARRAASSTHVRYDGVLLERRGSLRLGTGLGGVDIHLPSSPDAIGTWSIQLMRGSEGWVIDHTENVDQLRLSDSHKNQRSWLDYFKGNQRRWILSGSALLQRAGDWVAVTDTAGRVIDTLTLVRDREQFVLASRRSGTFLLQPMSDRLDSRYRQRLRVGATLSQLDGQSRASAAFVRFVRVRRASELRPKLAPWFDWFRETGPSLDVPLLVTATAPFRLEGALVNRKPLALTDSAYVEIKQGATVWSFALQAWQRTSSSGSGIALLFRRNPRPLNTPLPAGVNCSREAACAALSLRPLPAPISYVWLGHAGFSPSSHGLLGRLRETEVGFTVVLPRDTIAVLATDHRPTAIPVDTSDWEERSGSGTRANRWVLLSAETRVAQQGWTMPLVSIGVALLLLCFYRVVGGADFRVLAASTLQERFLSLGISAVLMLLLARTVVGIRVASFDPYLDRALETVVGMWIAIPLVTVSLVLWTRWVPALLTRARHAFRSRVLIREVLRGLYSLPKTVREWDWRIGSPLVIGIAALLCMAAVTKTGVMFAAVAASMVLLTWLVVAWVSAFASPLFPVFGSASAVVETHTGSQPVVRPASGRGARLTCWMIAWAPELALVVTCFAASIAVWAPWLVLSIVAMAFALYCAVPRLRKFDVGTRALVSGAGVYICALAAVREMSENGSLAAFLLVLLVTLVSVRIGRAVGARPASERKPFALSGLLIPLVLLVPLALLDMGLFLVMVIPIGFATVLAAGIKVLRGRAVVFPVAVALLLGFIVVEKVLAPSLEGMRRATTHAARADAFAELSEVFGVRPLLIGESLDRAAARGVATHDQRLAEELLISAAPGRARDLLMPSIEQIWGARAYARAGLAGVGTGQAIIGDRGVAEAVSYAENTFSVYVLAEHGWLGATMVLLAYMQLAIAVGGLALSSTGNNGASMRASRALFIVAALIVVVPGVYVAMSNIGVLPITGQNMPFLGLNAWSDVAICAGVVAMLVTGAIRNTEDAI